MPLKMHPRDSAEYQVVKYHVCSFSTRWRSMSDSAWPVFENDWLTRETLAAKTPLFLQGNTEELDRPLRILRGSTLGNSMPPVRVSLLRCPRLTRFASIPADLPSMRATRRWCGGSTRVLVSTSISCCTRAGSLWQTCARRRRTVGASISRATRRSFYRPLGERCC